MKRKLEILSSRRFYFLLSVIILSITTNYPQVLGYFVFIFLIPLLLIINDSDQNHIKSNKYFIKEMFIFGFLFSLLSTFYFFSTYPLDWMSIYNPVVSLIVIGGVWIFFGIAIGVSVMLWPFLISMFNVKNAVCKSLIGASVWVLLEYFRSWIIALAVYGQDTLFGPHHTYYSLGYTITHIPIIRELLPIGGLYLASFFIILCNYFLFYLYSNYKSNKKIKLETFLIFILLFTILITSYFVMKFIRKNETSNSSFNVSIVTTYLKSKEDYTQKDRDFVKDNFPNGVDSMSQLVISPEGFLISKLFDAPKKGSKQFFLGTVPSTTNKTIYLLDYSTNLMTFYNKKLLMPIGEYSLWWTNFIFKITQNKIWMDGYNFKYNQKDEKNVDSYLKNKNLFIFKDYNNQIIKIGVSLCSENISPYIYRNVTKEGVDFLINSSSHSPFRGSLLLSRQTLAVNTARAIENGRYFVVSSNYDKSFVLTDEGEIQNISTSTEIFSYFNADIKMKKYKTPYVNYGDYIVYISFGLLILCYISIFINRKIIK